MKEITIWPAYIDLKKTKNEGRKVPKSFGIMNPKIKDIFDQIQKMGHECTMDNKKSYPKEPWELSGYLKVKIDKNTSKLEFLKELSKKMK